MVRQLEHWNQGILIRNVSFPFIVSFRSAAYFSALSSGDTLPVKRRLEPFSSDGITMGNLEVLVQQYKGQEQEVSKKDLEQKWGKQTSLLNPFPSLYSRFGTSKRATCRVLHNWQLWRCSQIRQLHRRRLSSHWSS